MGVVTYEGGPPLPMNLIFRNGGREEGREMKTYFCYNCVKTLSLLEEAEAERMSAYYV